MEELWKPIKGYESKYEVSNFGRVKSLCCNRMGKITNRELIMSTHDNGNGYVQVILMKDNKRRAFYVHRLVAEAFIDNSENLKQVNHLDYDRKNNRVDNLEWCSAKENTIYSVCRRPKFRKYKTNTGEPFITYRASKKIYRVIIKQKEFRSCKTLDEAVKLRNEIIKKYGENILNIKRA